MNLFGKSFGWSSSSGLASAPFYSSLVQWLRGGVAPSTDNEVNDALSPLVVTDRADYTGNSCIAFDGVDGYGDLNYVSSLSDDIDCWFKYNGSTEADVVLFGTRESSTDYYFGVFLGEWRCGYGSGTTDAGTSDNDWHRITIIDGVFTLYDSNGENPVVLASRSGTFSFTENAYIGCRNLSGSPSKYANVLISRFRIGPMYYKLNSASMVDHSGQYTPVDLSGGASNTTSAGPPINIDEGFDTVLSMNRVDNVIVRPTLSLGASDFHVKTRFRVSYDAAIEFVVNLGATGTGAKRLGIRIQSTKIILNLDDNSSEVGPTIIDNTEYSIGDWLEVTCSRVGSGSDNVTMLTRNINTGLFYKETSTYTGDVSSTDPLTIGAVLTSAGGSSYGDFYGGDIDFVELGTSADNLLFSEVYDGSFDPSMAGDTSDQWKIIPSLLASSATLIPIFGQSQIKGSAPGSIAPPAELDKTYSNIYFTYNLGTTDADDSMVPLAKVSDSKWGIELVLADHIGTTDIAAVVKVCENGSSINPAANRWQDGQVNFELLVDAINETSRLMRAVGYTVTVPVIYMGLGYSDATNTSYATAYTASLTSLFASLRNRTAIADDCKIIIGRIHPHLPNATQANIDLVRQAQADFADYLVNSDDLPLLVDGIHYTKDGLITWGQRFVEACGITTQNAESNTSFIKRTLLSNPSGATHNGAESTIIQTDTVNGDLLARAIFSDDGLTFDARSMADFQAFVSGNDNVWIRWHQTECRILEIAVYDAAFTPTLGQYQRLAAYFVQGSCGGGMIEPLYDANGVVYDVNGEVVYSQP